MSKKKKKKKSSVGDDKPKKKKFKLKKLLKPIIFLLLIGNAIALWKPDLIQDDTQRERVEGIREQLIDLSLKGQDTVQDKAQVLGTINEAKQKLPEKILIGDQEIYVEDLIKIAADQLETIPADRYEKFKSSFCADVVATVSACTLE